MNTDLVMEPDYDQLPNGDSPQSIIAGGGTMQQVRGTYTTAVAVQRPRNIEVVRKRLLQESQLAGELFYYGWGAGSNKIEGASVKLAMAAARCFGNCVIESLPIQETPTAWIFTSAFVDLETGFTVTRNFRQSKKSVVAGKHDEERKDDMRFQIGQSKAARNVVLNALPEWLIDQAIDEAKSGVRNKIESLVKDKGLPAAADACIRGFAKVGVTPEAIFAKCDVATVNGLTLDHLVMLKGDLMAIQNGQERPENLFPGITTAAAGSKARPSDLNEKLQPKAAVPDAGPKMEASPAKPPATAVVIDAMKSAIGKAKTVAAVRKVFDDAQVYALSEDQTNDLDAFAGARIDKLNEGKQQQQEIV